MAVAAVVAFHLEHLPGRVPGRRPVLRAVGVPDHVAAAGRVRGSARIDLGRFWSRRARRLLPALFLLLGGLALLFAIKSLSQSPGFRGDALSTLGYVANWHAMARDIGYWDLFAQPSPLDHMWSLAIEEQFYLCGRPSCSPWCWPAAPVAAAGWSSAWPSPARLRRSPSWRSRGPPPTPAGPTTGPMPRVGPTLLGAALVALLASGRRRSATAPDAAVPEARIGGPPRPTGSWWPPVAGVAALMLLLWSFVEVRGTEPAYYRGGLAAFALAAVVVVAVVVRGRAGPLGAVLGFRRCAGSGSSATASTCGTGR